MSDLNLDVSAEEARALHRVVRAMHDGHCPKCGHLAPSFYHIGRPKNPLTPLTGEQHPSYHRCPVCGFEITEEEAKKALEAFQPYLRKSLDVFEKWRRNC